MPGEERPSTPVVVVEEGPDGTIVHGYPPSPPPTESSPDPRPVPDIHIEW